MTVTQTASGHEDALATALAVTISRLRTQSGHPGIACTPELSAQWNEQIRESLELGRAITNSDAAQCNSASALIWMPGLPFLQRGMT